jgi:hypothetical protein
LCLSLGLREARFKPEKGRFAAACKALQTQEWRCFAGTKVLKVSGCPSSYTYWNDHLSFLGYRRVYSALGSLP